MLIEGKHMKHSRAGSSGGLCFTSPVAPWIKLEPLSQRDSGPSTPHRMWRLHVVAGFLGSSGRCDIPVCAPAMIDGDLDIFSADATRRDEGGIRGGRPVGLARRHLINFGEELARCAERDRVRTVSG
jgi:hypothetical protein